MTPTSPPTRPFRTHLRTLPSREQPPASPTNQEVLDIDLSAHATPEDMERWLRHPDERVGMALLARAEPLVGQEEWAGRHCRAVDEHIIDVLLDLADSEGLVWTPLLDRAIQSTGWGKVQDNRLHTREQPETRLEMLRLWIESAPSEDLHDVLTFEWKAIRRLVAANAGDLDLDLLRTFLEDKSTILHLAGNPNLSPLQHEWILREASWRNLGESFWNALDQAGAVLSDRLLETAFLRPTRKRIESDKANSNWGGASNEWLARRAFLQLSNLEPEQLEALTLGLTNTAGDEWSWATIGLHPAASRETVLKASENTSGSTRNDILVRLASDPEIVGQPDIIRYVAKEGDWRAKLPLADYLDEEELEALVKTLRNRSVIHPLKQWMEGRIEPLPQSVRVCFLNHPDREIRLIAVTLLGTQPPTSGPSAEDPARSPNQRSPAVT